MKIGFAVYGGDGDIQPFIDLAIALAERNHTIQMFIVSIFNKDYGYLNDIEGFSVSQNPFPNEKMDEKFKSKAFWEFNEEEYRSYFKSQFDMVNGDFKRHSKRIAASCDLVISPRQLLALRFSAEVYKTPSISLALEHVFIKSKFYAPLEDTDGSHEQNLEKWEKAEKMALQNMLPYVNNQRKVFYQLPPLENFYEDLFYSKQLNLVRYSRHLLDYDLDWSPQHHICGYFKPAAKSINWEFPKALNQFIEDGTPPVLITLGSLINYEPDLNKFHSMIVDAVSKAKCRAIFKSDWKDNEQQTDNIYYLNAFVDYNKLMSSCSLVVHHGGAGTCHEAALSGVPSMIIAYGFDQFSNASVLKKAGICEQAISRKELNATSLAKALVASLENKSMIKKVKEISSKMSNEDGLNEAVNVIEKFSTTFSK